MTSYPPSQSDPFWTFEHTAWEKSARSYHNFWSHLTNQTIEPLPERRQSTLARCRTGAGNVAQVGTRKGAWVVGVDFSTAMLSQARKQYPDIACCEGDAETLPFANNSFDAVVINFGLLHFGNPEQALREAYRVLHPGRRISFTVWEIPEAAIGFQIMLQVIETHGDPKVSLPEGPPFLRFSDSAESGRTLRTIGFTNPSIAEVQQMWRFSRPMTSLSHSTREQRAPVNCSALNPR